MTQKSRKAWKLTFTTGLAMLTVLGVLMAGATSTESAHIPPSESGPRDVQADLLPTSVYTSSPSKPITAPTT